LITAARSSRCAKPLSIALCNEVVRNLGFREQCAFTRAVGYAGLEVAPFTLGADPGTLGTSEINEYRRIAESEGTTITGLHWLLAAPDGLSITSRDEDIHRRTIDFGQRLIEMCRDLGGHYLVHGSPAQRKLETGCEGEGRKRGIAYFAEMSDAASLAGVDYIIEPLSRSTTNFISTVEEAVNIISQVGSDCLLTMIDCYASASDNQDICKLVEQWVPSGLIRHIHFNDDNARGPGEGSIDFAPVLATLSKLEYTGTCAVEPFEYEADGRVCAARAVGYLQGIVGAINSMQPTNQFG